MAPPILLGTYAPQALRKGDRATCLYRDTECVVTSWTEAPIPWPRVRALEHRGGSGLLVDETLLRAIRTESVQAMMHWFGVGHRCVWCWRKTIGVSQVGTEGSRRLVLAAGAKGADATRGKERSEEYCENLSRTAKGRRISGRWIGKGWTPGMQARLGKESDDVLAQEFGKTTGAVRVRRSQLGIPSANDRRKRHPRPATA